MGTSAFAHSLHGHPLHVVMRPMDNPLLDQMIRTYRTMHGNKTVDKDDFVRGLLARCGRERLWGF